MSTTYYPVSEEERAAIHAARSAAEDKMGDIPEEHWPAIRELVAANRKCAALYGYMCSTDAEFRAYASLDA